MRKKIKMYTDQRPFTIIYNDCLKSDLFDNHYQIVIYVFLKMFADKNNQCYPSVKTLSKLSKIGVTKVKITLKELEEKHLISKENRTKPDGSQRSNLYTLYDFKELWSASNSEEAAAAVDEYEEKMMVEILRARGYNVNKDDEEVVPDNATVMEDEVVVTEETATIVEDEETVVEESPIVTEEMVAEEESATAIEETVVLENNVENVGIKEKGLVSGSVQTTDTSTTTTSINLLSSENNTIQTKESQPLEKYSLDWIKQRFDYDILLHNNPYNKDDIDSVMDILYTNLNTTKKAIRINGEDKPASVVIGKLLKLKYWDIEYAIEKFKEQIDRIKNPLSYMLTILYHAPEQNNLDVQNLVNYNMYGMGREKQPKSQNNFDQNRSKNQFHQFHQRDVTQEELDELEQRLLERV